MILIVEGPLAWRSAGQCLDHLWDWWARRAEPVSLLREPLCSRQGPYRPAHSPTKCQRTLVGPMGFPSKRNLIRRDTWYS